MTPGSLSRSVPACPPPKKSVRAWIPGFSTARHRSRQCPRPWSPTLWSARASRTPNFGCPGNSDAGLGAASHYHPTAIGGAGSGVTHPNGSRGIARTRNGGCHSCPVARTNSVRPRTRGFSAVRDGHSPDRGSRTSRVIHKRGRPASELGSRLEGRAQPPSRFCLGRRRTTLRTSPETRSD